MRLLTRRLILRPVRAADVPYYFELDSDPAVAGPLGLGGRASLARTRRSVLSSVRDWRRKRPKRLAFTIVSRRGGKPRGGLNLRWPHAGVAELGCAIDPRHQGRGYATEAVRRVVELAFGRLGAHRVQATCWVRNPASARVLEKAGLKREGRLRGYLRRGLEVRDEFMFGMTLSDLKGSSGLFSEAR